MATTLSTFDRVFGVRRFPPGRLYTVLLAMNALADAAALHELVARIGEGVTAVKVYVELRRRRQIRRLGRGGGEAKRVDKIIDDDIAEIAHVAAKEAARFPDTPTGKAAQALVDAFFMHGVAPVTQIPYDEELAVVEHMVPLMRAEHGEAIRLLGIERLVSRIEAHLPLYREALAPDEAVSSAELGAAYEAMQVGLLRALGWVMAMVDDPGLRDRLLAPMIEHDNQLAALYAARRRGSSAGGEDVATDEFDLDAEAREAMEAAERDEAAADAAAAAEADAPAVEAPAVEAPAVQAPAVEAPAADDPALRPLRGPVG